MKEKERKGKIEMKKKIEKKKKNQCLFLDLCFEHLCPAGDENLRVTCV
mgnify:CR=1 FL=1